MQLSHWWIRFSTVHIGVQYMHFALIRSSVINCLLANKLNIQNSLHGIAFDMCKPVESISTIDIV